MSEARVSETRLIAKQGCLKRVYLADGKTIRFLNINDQLKDDLGNLLPGVSRDGLHLEEKGYDLWASALKPIFTELLGPPAEMD